MDMFSEFRPPTFDPRAPIRPSLVETEYASGEHLYKNWAAIRAVADEVARKALRAAHRPETLQRLSLGWPECFQKEKPTYQVVSRSTIERLIREWVMNDLIPDEESDDGVLLHCFLESNWWPVLEGLNIPVVFEVGSETDFGSKYVPLELRQQLVGRTIKAGDVFEYCGSQIMLVSTGLAYDCIEGIVDEEKIERCLHMVFIPAKCVDLQR